MHQSYYFQVLVSCAQCTVNQLSVDFNVSVIDVNDNLHAFVEHTTSNTVYFAENSPSESRVRLPSALDEDSPPNSPVSYAVLTSSSHSMPFHVITESTPTGDVVPYVQLKGSLDYETTKTYKFTLLATDKEGRNNSVLINIKVIILIILNLQYYFTIEYNNNIIQICLIIMGA